MISPEKIKQVTKTLATALNVPFVRAEDDGDRPRCMFLSYKTLNQENEQILGQIDTYSPIVGNDTKVRHKKERKSSLTVSYTLIGPAEEYYSIWESANAAIRWFESEQCDDACAAQDVSAGVKGPVQDRTAFLETKYETRLGFDVGFIGNEVVEEDLDAVDITKTLQSIEEVS
ncbi:MAG TPA: hypothetical protein PKY31_00800 [Spirochaetota bacterium]|nr:hypothetical protein [Spirochaetota bacterium]